MTRCGCQVGRTADDSAHALVTSASTPLKRLLEDWNSEGNPHRLVQSDTGLIEGMLDLREVHRMLTADNAVERSRWEGVTAGAVAQAVFVARNEGTISTAMPPAAGGRIVEGIPICDRQGCVAVVVNGETFVSWERVAAAMEQNQFDPVTQLPTRLSFSRRLQEEINRSGRSEQPLAVLLIDLDHFKEINDRFGHSTGDAALSLIADSLRAGVRSYDFVARFAGDEFVVICYACRSQDVRLPIARLRRALAARLQTFINPELQVSLSIGVAAVAHIDSQCPPELIVEQADACLYEAKRAGRATAFAVELDSMGNALGAAYEIRAED